MYKPLRTCEEIEYCNINEAEECSFRFVENGFVESFAEALVFLPLCAFVDVKRASRGIHVSLQFMFLKEKRETMLEVCRSFRVLENVRNENHFLIELGDCSTEYCEWIEV